MNTFVLVVVCGSMQLSKCHRVAVSRDAGIQLNITRERDSN